MSLMLRRLASLSFAATLMLALGGCKAAMETPEAIDWKISWQPATTHEDNTPITTTPTYELEMAAGEGAGHSWKVVWTGAETTAVFKGPPGRHCFRAVTVENGVRSKPSQINCATKNEAGES